MVPGVEPQGFVSPPVWLDGPSDISGILREDWVNKTDPTDVNYFSIGCSVLFLNWLRFQLNFTWTQIIAAGTPTLAGTYKNLAPTATVQPAASPDDAPADALRTARRRQKPLCPPSPEPGRRLDQRPGHTLGAAAPWQPRGPAVRTARKSLDFATSPPEPDQGEPASAH